MSLEKYIDKWLEIGRKNPWISQAYDPPFSERSFYECSSLEELKSKFVHCNWCCGAAFVLGDLCFISQGEGIDEWLTIKQDTSFDSISCAHIIERNSDFFDRMIARIQALTQEQCAKWEYWESGVL